MLGAIIGIGVVAVLLGLGFYFTRGGGSVPGGRMDDPAVPGPYGPIMPSNPIGAHREPSDEPARGPDPQAEAEAWQRERERYREKDQQPDAPEEHS